MTIRWIPPVICLDHGWYCMKACGFHRLHRYLCSSKHSNSATGEVLKNIMVTFGAFWLFHALFFIYIWQLSSYILFLFPIFQLVPIVVRWPTFTYTYSFFCVICRSNGPDAESLGYPTIGRSPLILQELLYIAKQIAAGMTIILMKIWIGNQSAVHGWPCRQSYWVPIEMFHWTRCQLHGKGRKLHKLSERSWGELKKEVMGIPLICQLSYSGP